MRLCRWLLIQACRCCRSMYLSLLCYRRPIVMCGIGGLFGNRSKPCSKHNQLCPSYNCMRLCLMPFIGCCSTTMSKVCTAIRKRVTTLHFSGINGWPNFASPTTSFGRKRLTVVYSGVCAAASNGICNGWRTWKHPFASRHSTGRFGQACHRVVPSFVLSMNFFLHSQVCQCSVNPVVLR